MICQECTTDFIPKRVGQMFCSKRCANNHSDRQLMEAHPCIFCGTSFAVSRGLQRARNHAGVGAICPSCVGTAEHNSRWKGGHRHWSPGRYGKDKDGLSWKTQRRLAWQRDDETCQHCHTKKNRKPDVHHIVPFRISLSHALDNLLCLCQSCHLIEEAKVQDRWGGQLVEHAPPSPPKGTLVCEMCGKFKQASSAVSGVCYTCTRRARAIEANKIIERGGTQRDIMRLLGASKDQAWDWTHRFKPEVS